MAAGLVAAGLKGHGFRLRDRQRTLLRIPYDGLDTPFPYLLLISQLIRPDGYLAACGVPADPAAVLPRLSDYAQAT